MATIRAIKRRIKSAKNISQVTRAMEMVSAVKMRKAQETALAGRVYVEELEKMVGILASGKDLEEKSILLTTRKNVNRILLLVVAPKKGLCGALVTNLYRSVLGFVVSQTVDVSFVTLEKKSRDIVRTFGKELLADFTISAKQPSIEFVRPISDYLVEQFMSGKVDLVLVAYTHFINTVSQKAVVKQFLPVVPQAKEETEKRGLDATILFEPSASEVLDSLLVRYSEATLYQIVLEAAAAEHSARMVAMKNAHDNASDIISDLTLYYNKARQNAITSELSDAMGSRMAQSAS